MSTLPDALNAKIETLLVSIDDLDRFIASKPHICRNISGHCFEVWFDQIIQQAGQSIEAVGGDVAVDRRLNGHTLQLKTPYWNGTKDGVVAAYRMHKTHGPEVKPDCLYTRTEFADFLVAIHPTSGVIICPRDSMPLRGEVQPGIDYPERIADPTPFPWNSQWLNRYDLLGVTLPSPPPTWKPSEYRADLFPHIAKEVGFGDYEIIHALSDLKNFRTWDQLIVGSIRELHFTKFASANGIRLEEPTHLTSRERNKVDFVVAGKRIQVKGLTRSLCRGTQLGCEIKGSHGRIPNRLYRRSDFDVLVVVIDPGTIPSDAAISGVKSGNYNFAIFPVSALSLHERSREWGGEYLKDIFRFDVRTTTLNNLTLLNS